MFQDGPLNSYAMNNKQSGQSGQLTVYKASAGSGKTFTLSAEYIAHLLCGEPTAYRHILAVTFTNKATAEMKERILSQLWEMAHADAHAQAQDGFFRAVAQRLHYLSGQEITRRAATALSDITHDYDRFRIETIDAFFQSLLTCLARELGLSSSFRVDINDREVTERAVDVLMKSLQHRPEVKKWVLDYIKDRIEENRRWDVSGDIKDLARHLMTEKFLLHDEELMEVLDNAERMHNYRSQLRSIERKAMSALQVAASALDKEICQQDKGYSAFSRGNSLATYLKNIQEGQLTEPGATVRGYIEKAENWVRKADLKKDPSLCATAEAFRIELISIENQREKSSYTINSCKLTLGHINPLRLMGEINREVSAICDETGRFMLAKTPQLFFRLVDKADADFVFERAGTEFHHIMIDEFQDTSTLQWHNFKTLLLENMSKGNSCLLVGDVKQGIYRFRNGDWNILAGVEKEFKNWKPQIETLARNFRSSEHIIEFNNMLFPTIAGLIDRECGTSDVCNLYADVRQAINDRKGGHVRIRLEEKKATSTTKDVNDGQEGTEVSIEEDMVDEIINLHRRGVKYKDMAILVRFNKSTTYLLSYFAEHHPEIPIISDEAFLLKSSPAVLLLINAMRNLAYPDDDIARAHLIHTYRNLALQENRRWAEIAENAETLLPLEYVQRREEFLDLPLYELTTTLINLFHPENIEGSAPYLFCFLDAVLAYLNDYNSRLHRFLSYWDESLCNKAIPADQVEGIRILTIHKSKGLAFHSVFMPHTDWTITKGPLNELLWCSPNQAPYNELPLIPINLHSGKTITNSIYAEDYRQEMQKRYIENLNLIYVAFTRAIQNLYVWGRCERIKNERKSGSGLNTVADLLYMALCENLSEQEGCFFYESGTPSSGSQEKKQKNHNPLILQPQQIEVDFQQAHSRATYRQSNAASRFFDEQRETKEGKQEEYINRGKLLHYIFSGIKSADDIDDMLAQVVAEGLVGKSKEQESLHRFITQRIRKSVACSWFDGTWKVYNECSILVPDSTGKTVTHRPDRVMMRDGKVLVVDFKFGTAKAPYSLQVAGYCQLLKAMGHHDVTGYLWYVYSDEVEEVFHSINPH